MLLWYLNLWFLILGGNPFTFHFPFYYSFTILLLYTTLEEFWFLVWGWVCRIIRMSPDLTALVLVEGEIILILVWERNSESESELSSGFLVSVMSCAWSGSSLSSVFCISGVGLGSLSFVFVFDGWGGVGWVWNRIRLRNEELGLGTAEWAWDYPHLHYIHKVYQRESIRRILRDSERQLELEER